MASIPRELRALVPCVQNIAGNHLELGVPLEADSFQLVPREVLCEFYLRRLACFLLAAPLPFVPTAPRFAPQLLAPPPPLALAVALGRAFRRCGGSGKLG